MDKHQAVAGSAPSGARRSLKSKLDQSIEAHRLRLQKAREAKYLKSGPLCECQNCDVTSMKPSMRCLKAGGRRAKSGNKQKMDSARLPMQPKPPVEAPRPPLESVRQVSRKVMAPVDKPILATGPTKRVVDPVPEKKESMVLEDVEEAPEAVSHQKSFAEYCQAFEIRDPSIPRTESRASREFDSLSVVERLPGKEKVDEIESADLTKTTMLDGRKSSRSVGSSARSLSVLSSKSGNDTDEDRKQVQNLVQKLGSISIRDSQGDEHRLDTTEMASKIYTFVSEVVNGKLSCRETAPAEVRQKEPASNENQKYFSAFDCCHSHPSVDGNEAQEDDADLGLESIKSLELPCSRKNSSTDATTINEAEDVDRYKNVVDVLLDYISSSRTEKTKLGSESTRQDAKAEEVEHDVGNFVASTQVVREPQVMQESQAAVEQPSASGATAFWNMAKKPFLCCNTFGSDSGGQEKAEPATRADSGNFGQLNGVFVGEAAQMVTGQLPGRIVTSALGQPEPMGYYMASPQEMAYYMPYGQPGPHQYFAPFPMQTAYTPKPYNYNPTVCPTVNCCMVKNSTISYPMQPMQQARPQMSRQQFAPFSRTPSVARTKQPSVNSQAPNRPQRKGYATPQVQRMPRMPTGLMPRMATGGMTRVRNGVVPRVQTGVVQRNTNLHVPEPTSAIQAFAKPAPRQATGPLYRRNTGRAHLRQIQATMI